MPVMQRRLGEQRQRVGLLLRDRSAFPRKRPRGA